MFLLCSGNLLVGQVAHSTPDQKRPTAEIDYASREAFIHRHITFAGKRIPRVETGAIAANPFLVAERFQEGLAQSDAAILDGVVSVHLEVAFATQVQIDHRMLRKERQHVVEKRDAGFDQRFPAPVNVQFDKDVRLFADSLHLSVPLFHTQRLNNPPVGKQSENPCMRIKSQWDVEPAG